MGTESPPRPTRRVLGIILGVAAMAFGVYAIVNGLGQIFGPGLGTRIAVGTHGELYYAKDVAEPEAQAVVSALKGMGHFADTGGETVALAKTANGLALSFVVKPGLWDDPKTAAEFEAVGAQVTARALGGRPLEVRLCDDHMKARKVVPVQLNLGTRMSVGSQGELYYAQGVTEHEAQQVVSQLTDLGYFKDQGATVLLAKKGDGFALSLVVRDGLWDDSKMVTAYREAGSTVSGRALGGRLAELRLCDTNLTVRKVIPMLPEIPAKPGTRTP